MCFCTAAATEHYCLQESQSGCYTNVYSPHHPRTSSVGVITSNGAEQDEEDE